MSKSALEGNALTLSNEFAWLENVIRTRLQLVAGKKADVESIYEIPAPELKEEDSFYAALVSHYQMNTAERLLILLALSPHLQPHLLAPFAYSDQFSPQYGCIINHNSNRILPTRQTAYFLLGESNLTFQFSVSRLLEQDHFLRKHHILQFASLPIGPDNPETTEGALSITDEYLTYLTTGDEYTPDYSATFPAKLITTPLEWEELVLPLHVMEDINDMLNWIKFGHIIMEDWGLSQKVKRGYRALFHGTSGTGKTLTASLLGKVTKTPVYRVDLAMTISKYIGETEKNLKNLFDQAENKKWVLFFDEADALFSNRVATKDSHDRSANQQIAYLLQRVEDYDGLVILSSNLRQGLDEAFTRRFETIIYFPKPDAEQRLTLWQNYFTEAYYELEEKIKLEEIAEKYELTGGNIINVLKYCCLRAIGRNAKTLLERDIIEGIRKELVKGGKTM